MSEFERKLGHYKCCTTWSSGYSWAFCPQQCAVCLKDVYAYKQRSLQKRGIKNKKARPHRQKLCGKCCDRELSCSESASLSGAGTGAEKQS